MVDFHMRYRALQCKECPCKECFKVAARSLTESVMQPQLQLITPSIRATPDASGNVGNWTATVDFRNAGLAAGRFTLDGLDSGLVPSARSWDMQAWTPAEPTRLTLRPKSDQGGRPKWNPKGTTPACGVLSDGVSSARFCITG